MTYNYYLSLIGEYINAGRSQERFCADIGYPDNAPSEEQFLKSISVIAAAADQDIKALISLSNLSMAAFARKFQIPARTVQDWNYGSRKPPEYLPILIGFILVSELWNQDNDDI